MNMDPRSIFRSQATERDEAWQAEVRREVAREFAAREGHSLPANTFAWLVCLILGNLMGLTALLVAALAFRIFSIAATHWACARVRRALDHGEPFEDKLRIAGLTLASSGLSWGMLTWAVTGNPAADFTMIGLLSVVTVGVCLICSVAGLVPFTLASFALSFAASVLFGGFVVNGGQQPEIVGVVLLPVIGALSWGAAVKRQAFAAAADAVDNLYLREELADALHNAEFLSRHDALTGLANRRALFEDHAQPVSHTRFLLAVDLDHFKGVNDRFGHCVGDDVLIAVADLMRRTLREHDLPGGAAYRLGGEEFALVLDAVDRVQAERLAETLREAMSGSIRLASAPRLRITASFGLYAWEADTDLQVALGHADEALYRAKAQGRNRIAGVTGRSKAA